MALTRIAELAGQIRDNTAKVDEYLQSEGLPSPSFDEDGPVDFKIEDKNVQFAREAAIDASLELHQLLLGPALCLRPVVSKRPFHIFFSAYLWLLIAQWHKPPSNLQVQHRLQGAHSRQDFFRRLSGEMRP